MVKIDLSHTEPQDCETCLQVAPDLIRSTCVWCRTPVFGRIIEGKPGMYAPDYQSCGYSADAYFDVAALEKHDELAREFFCRRTRYSDVGEFLERLRSQLRLVTEFNRATIRVGAADWHATDEGERIDEFVLLAEVEILDQTIRLKQCCGLDPAKITVANSELRQACTELGLAAQKLR